MPRRFAATVLLALISTPVAVRAASPLLLPPARRVGMSVEEALSRRRSTKDFAPGGRVTPAEVSQLLWAAVGINRADGKKRTIPSALASYGITVYLADGRGVHRYLPDGHRLEEVRHADGAAGDVRGALLKQGAYQQAPVVLLLVADANAYPDRFPLDARRIWAATECGCVAQNVYLQAAALDLGTVVVAAIHKDVAQEVLGLKAGQELMYAMPVGRPKVDSGK